ncbi:MAG: DNA-formamidopyrimidine glycosylase family protein, partial [Actinomycetota bacterium]|nr:DNA-formamidopyrimidine glycosylase family protein [Actinomycetota bacterium]
MPELPEVEVVRRGIDAWATNRTISRVDVLHARSIRRCEGGAPELRAALEGDSFRCASRRGKYLWLPLTRTKDQALVVHLGMSGQVLLRQRDADDGPLTRIRLDIVHPE